MESENKSEESWELYDLCKQFLEENSKDWEKRKIARELEKERILRLERARIKTKTAKLNQLRKNVMIGEQKLPEKEREKMDLDEKKKRRIELQQSKKDLWALRKKEKKAEITPTLQEIRTLAQKAEKIVEILKNEKKKVEEEKRKLEQEKEVRKIKDQQKEKRLEKQKLLTEKWALYRWITEYIDENNERWDRERTDRKETEEKRIAEWEKKNRFEKIRELKRKLREKKTTGMPENREQNAEKAENWTVWRSEKSVNKDRPTTQNHASPPEPVSTTTNTPSPSPTHPITSQEYPVLKNPKLPSIEAEKNRKTEQTIKNP